jgi:addiction module HigA family antidote
MTWIKRDLTGRRFGRLVAIREDGLSGYDHRYIKAIHPGEFLAEILDELELSQSYFADATGVSPMRISHVVKGTRPVTAELALRFGKALGQTPEYWINLQTAYDLATARDVVELRKVRPVLTVPIQSCHD